MSQQGLVWLSSLRVEVGGYNGVWGGTSDVRIVICADNGVWFPINYMDNFKKTHWFGRYEGNHTAIYRPHRTHLLTFYRSGMKKEFITTYEYNPEFFPTTIDELAGDAFDSIQLGLISKINRLRIDIRLDIIEKERNLLLFLGFHSLTSFQSKSLSH